MSVIVPKETNDPRYIVGFSGLFSFAGPWIDTNGFGVITFNAWWTAFAATAGTLVVEGSNVVTPGVLPAPTAGSIAALVLTTPTGGTMTGIHGNSGSVTVGASASSVILTIDRLPRLLRLAYTRGAGGTDNQFFAATCLRAV